MPFAIYTIQLSCRPIGVNSVVNILHIRGLLEIYFFDILFIIVRIYVFAVYLITLFQ
jgi:hypothetical protein